MNWHKLIFSDNKWQRLCRHFLFWLVWWVYFTLSYFHYGQTGLMTVHFEPLNAPFFFESVLLLSIHIMACYYFINFLIPTYLLKARYGGLAVQILFLSLAILFSSYFLHRYLFPSINSLFSYTPKTTNDHIWWTSISAGLLSAPKVISAAAAWKIIKGWWRKQQEKERLEQEKLVTDLQLLKAQIHPDFLFSTLDNISELTESKDVERASMVLLKLADILSYMLYDCDNRLVLLDKEIKIIKDYMAVQKIRMGESLEVDIAVKGDTARKKVAPLLLFSIIENCFVSIGNQQSDNCWINIEFEVDSSDCIMKVIHGKTEDEETVTLNKSVLDNTTKRLDFFYPGNYDLKTRIEPDMLMIYLKIGLEEPVTENTGNIYYPESIAYATV
jgi:hypothetical protein